MNAPGGKALRLAGAETRAIPAGRLWTQGRLSLEMLIDRPSLLFVPSHVIPFVHPPSVVTIHDLGFLHYPDAHDDAQRRMLDRTTRWNARVARRIIVPSHQTADDLESLYDVPPERITVIPHGVDERYFSRTVLPNPVPTNRPFILAVGTLQPRKNLPIVARAMANHPVLRNLDFVIAGKKGWKGQQVLDELGQAGLGSRLHVLSYVQDDVMPALYRHARAFIQPSLFEGFGMPVLEALASGIPVITTNTSSLKELGGDAVVRVDERDEAAIARAIERVAYDAKERSRLVERSVAVARDYSWEQSARKTRLVLYGALKELGFALPPFEET